MVDKSNAEINAAFKVFDDEVRLLLCASRRSQACWQWLHAGHNGIPNTQQKPIFDFLKTIADALSISELQTRVQNFKAKYYTSQYLRLQGWLEGNWFNCLELWVRCHRLGKCKDTWAELLPGN